jgi:anti-sigma-K factor RskA
MTPVDDHDDDVALAGEYALHLLDAQARQAFEDRLKDDPALRRLVADWDQHFVSLADEIVPVAPPPALKARIHKTLFATPAKTTASVWRLLMGAGFAAALGLAVLVVLPPTELPDGFTPAFTAELAAEDQSLVVLASYAPDAGILRIDRQAGSARPGRVLELWLIADGSSVPVSLGVLPDQTATDIALPPALADSIAGGTLAISDEPPGGSTTGAPTGDVLAAGPVVSI